VTLDVQTGETVFTAARRQGYTWPTICGGQGTCRTCYVTVKEGAEHCAPMPELEQEGIEALGRPLDGALRLACQLRVEGPVVVVRRGVHREKE
jgi:2Fe-2S ferredoxin